MPTCRPRWRLNENRATSCICFELCSLWNRQSCDGFVFLRLSGCSLATSDTFGTPDLIPFPAPYQNHSASLENPDRQRKADVILGAHRLFILLWSRLFLKIDHLCCLLMPQSCKDLIFRPTNTNEEMEKQRNSCSSAPIKQRRLPVTRWLLVFNAISAICTGTSALRRARKLPLGADHKEKKNFGLNGMYCWAN